MPAVDGLERLVGLQAQATGWDNVLRSHDDRSRVMNDEHRAALRLPNDVVPGTVLLDGFLAATWGQEINGAGATLTVEPLTP
jgi:hypothetical protein